MYSKVGLKITIPLFPIVRIFDERGSHNIGEERIFFKGMVEEMIGRGIPLKVWNKMIMMNQYEGQNIEHIHNREWSMDETLGNYYFEHLKYPKKTEIRFDKESKREFHIWSKEETEEWKEVFWEEIIPTLFHKYEKFIRYELWDLTTNHRIIVRGRIIKNNFYYDWEDWEIPSWSLNNRKHMEKCWGKNYWKNG
jgi:hypothetical protein